MIESLKKAIEDNKIDYEKLKADSVILLRSPDILYDINCIIPVKGRADFSSPMFYYFSKAKQNSDLKINYTIVELSENPEHSRFCKKNNIDYIFLQEKPNELFNKCLAMNFGAFFSRQSKYLLFHDLDCLMPSNFFVNLMENIKTKNCRAIQGFTERRVLYLDKKLTEEAILNNLNIDSLSKDSKGVMLPQYLGAPGGSIMIERSLFFEIGGYEPEVFRGNAPEDIFFWTKINSVSKIEISNSPKIELFHMLHPPTYYGNPFEKDMRIYYNAFNSLSLEHKIEFINFKRDLIKEFTY